MYCREKLNNFNKICDTSMFAKKNILLYDYLLIKTLIFNHKLK